MNALEKRDQILRALASRPDSLAILAKYGVSRTDIGKNMPNFATVRDAMFAELCPTIEPIHGGTFAPPCDESPVCDSSPEIITPAPSFPAQVKTQTPSTTMNPTPARSASVQELTSTLESTLAALKGLASTSTPAEVDLTGIQSQIDDLEARTQEGFNNCESRVGDVEAQIAALNATLSSAPAPVKHAAAMAVAKATGGLSPACSLMAKLVPPHGNVTASAVMLVGGSGTGKSYDAELHARAFDFAPAPFACSPMTESFELVGAVTQTPAGLAFVDGAVSSCMRRAANGESVCIILDEFPRLSDNLKMIFLTMLTPRIARGGKFDGMRVFSLRTGNSVMSSTGVWEPEIIDAPVESVAFVATGNIGEQFNVRSGGVDEAVWKRFVHLRVNWDASIALGIFERELDACGFPASIAKSVLLPFVEKTREMAEHESLAYPACVRTVTRAIRIAAGGSKKTLRSELEALCENSFCGWEHNGATTPANLDAVKSLIHPLLSPLA